jgi:guanylate kinase
VDVIGGLNLKRFFGDNALAIFVQPPSYDELEKRLRYRSTETEEKIQQRMAKAKAELAKAVEFDVVLVNDTLEHAIEKATELVHNFIQEK